MLGSGMPTSSISHVRLRFKLAAGLGDPCTRDGGIPQECPLSMMFIVVLYLPWRRYPASQEGVEPQLLIIPSVCRGIHDYFCVLVGSLLGMSGWLDRNPHPVSVC